MKTKNKGISIIVAVTVALSILVTFSAAASATTWTVDDNGPANFTTILAAIDAASDGDTIIVAAGTYTDDIWNSSSGIPAGYRITKSITLLGAQAGNDPAGSTDRGGETILVRTNGLPYSLYASNITIDGFTIGSSDPDTGGRLIIADNADDVTIRNCIIQNTPSASSGHGVYIYPGAENALIEYNTFYNTAWEAIASGGASDAVISHNYISQSGQHAIQWMNHAGSNNEITYNHISNITDKTAIQYWGGSGVIISHNVIVGGNTMNDGIWLDNAADGSTVSYNQISDTIYAGINVREYCTGATITYNNISSCGTGVEKHSGDATGVTVNYNSIHGNSFGVANYDSTAIDATNNWWGDASGPYHSTNPGGLGDAVSDNVLYDPWTGKVDLTPTAITAPALFAGEPDTISATIANTGTLDAASFNVSLSADGTVVDTASVASLGAGANTDVSFIWTPPGTGSYNLCVVADCDGDVNESDETNNEICETVTVPVNHVILVSQHSSASYGETTTVEVYADTTDMFQGGQFYLEYLDGCADIIDVTFDSMWPYTTKDLTTYPGAVFATFRKDPPMVSGTQHICTLTIQCNNPGYCQSDLQFKLEGEVPAGKGSKLKDDYGTSLVNIGWHDGTFTCMNLPDLVITEVYGEQQTGDDYVVHYTVENQGNAPAAAGHTATLSIGEADTPGWSWIEDQVVPVALAPEESYEGTFATVLTMTAPNDLMNVCADTGSAVMELDEDNNCMESFYPAGIEIRVVAPDECVDFQEQFTVNITVDPRNIPVYGIQYVLSFDNTVLHAEWQNEGTFLNSDGADTNMYINTIDNGAGTVSFAATRTGTTDGVIDSGTLTTIKFTAIRQGADTNLTLSDVIAANAVTGGEILPLDLIGDQVCVWANLPPVAIGESLHMYNNDGQKYICKVYFDGTASYDPDGALVNWRWSYGDGNYGTGETVDHVYQSWNWNTETGEYEPFNVSLTVTDDADPHQLDNTTYLEVIVYTAGDANADGKVNILDATIVGLEWGETTTYGTRTDKADLNNDGKVNILDAVIIGTCWGHTAW